MNDFKVRHINILILILVLTFNSIIFSYTLTLSFFFINIFPFLVFLGIYYFFKSFKIDAYLFFVLSVLCTIFGEYDSTTGMFYFCAAIYCMENKKLILIVSIIILTTIVIKFTFFYTSVPRSFNFLIGYLHIFLIYVILWSPHFFIKELKEKDQEIIKFLIAGFTIKNISDQLKLSPGAVRKRITNLKQEFNCETNEQLIYKLIETGNLSIKKRIV